MITKREIKRKIKKYDRQGSVNGKKIETRTNKKRNGEKTKEK